MKRTILLALPTIGVMIICVLLYLGLIPPRRTYRRTYRRVYKTEVGDIEKTIQLVGRDGKLQLYSIGRSVFEEPLNPNWTLQWGKNCVLNLSASEGNGELNLSVLEEKKQRVSLLYDTTKDTLRELRYWLHGDDGWLEVRTDIDLDGTIDLVVSSRLKGAQILLDGEWVRARNTDEGWVVQFPDKEVPVKFEDGKWVLCDR